MLQTGARHPRRVCLSPPTDTGTPGSQRDGCGSSVTTLRQGPASVPESSRAFVHISERREQLVTTRFHKQMPKGKSGETVAFPTVNGGCEASSVLVCVGPGSLCVTGGEAEAQGPWWKSGAPVFWEAPWRTCITCPEPVSVRRGGLRVGASCMGTLLISGSVVNTGLLGVLLSPVGALVAAFLRNSVTQCVPTWFVLSRQRSGAGGIGSQDPQPRPDYRGPRVVRGGRGETEAYRRTVDPDDIL